MASEDNRGATAEDFHRNFPTNEDKRKRLDEVSRRMGLRPLAWTEDEIRMAVALGILEPSGPGARRKP